MPSINEMIKSLKAYFKAAPGSIKGYVNTNELIRVMFFAIAAGSGSSVILSTLNQSLNTILVRPEDVAISSAVLVAIIEIQRRLQHGQVLPVDQSAAASDPAVKTPSVK